MPDLESLITGWRREMRSARLTPSVLEELENHLREDVERRLASGAAAPEAFAAAVQRLGPPRKLQDEFAKVDAGLSPRERKVHRVLGIVLVAMYVLMAVGWIFNIVPGAPLTMQERWLGAAACVLFPLVASWKFTHRFLPVLLERRRRVAVWVLSSMIGSLTTVALIQMLPANLDGSCRSPYLGAFVWCWLPMVIGVSLITGLDQAARRRPALA